jgi:hypothetical protein
MVAGLSAFFYFLFTSFRFALALACCSMMFDELFAFEGEAVCVVTAAQASTRWLSIIIESTSMARRKPPRLRAPTARANPKSPIHRDFRLS